MPAGNTYEPIATQTLGSAAATVTFSSIPSTYTDLVLVFNGVGTVSGENMLMRYNGDTGSNYSETRVLGTGSSALSFRTSSQPYTIVGNLYTELANAIIQVQNYSNATTYKTSLCRNNSSGNVVGAIVNLWRSTTAINSIGFLLTGGSFATGSTFTLYGIKAA